MIKQKGKMTSQETTGQAQGSRVEITSALKQRHVIRFGPDWGDILVIEGNAPDKDVTKGWAEEHGPQSSDCYNAWAKPEL